MFILKVDKVQVICMLCLKYVRQYGKTRQSAIARNMKKQNGAGIFFSNLLIFVNFDMFTIHVLRNSYDKME